MTPKEKAKDLIEKFSNFDYNSNLSLEKTKNIVLLSLNETIKLNKFYIKKSFKNEVNDIVIAINNINKFFEKVIIEIENYE